VNFAIKTDVARTFLASNGISAATGSGREVSAARSAIARAASPFWSSARADREVFDNP
jgi:hypothetical protein